MLSPKNPTTVHFWCRAICLLMAVILTSSCSTPQHTADTVLLAKKGIAENRPFRWKVNYGMMGVRFGMRSREVKEILGKPSERIGHAWQYDTIGIAINFEKHDQVLSFSAGDGSDPNGLLSKAFKGITERGIRMGSKEEAVIRAYGSPSSRQASGDIVSLVYSLQPHQRLVFLLQNGRVFHITAVRE